MNKQEIKKQQMEWAQKKKLETFSNHLDYIAKRNDNLFRPLTAEQEQAFGGGAGGELNGKGNTPPKMNALHSSSALTVNVFAYPATTQNDDKKYWNNLFGNQAMLSGTGKIECTFEKQLPIMNIAGHHPPHLDFFIADEECAIGVESKFTEHASPHNNIIQSAYFDNFSLWDKIPGLVAFAKRINSGEEQFHYLNAAQLMKHTLGLISWQATFGIGDYSKLSLAYLYFRHTGKTAFEHDKEVMRYAETMQKLLFKFVPISYQEFIQHMVSIAKTINDPILGKHAEYLLCRYVNIK